MSNPNSILYNALVKLRQLIVLQSMFKELSEFDNFKKDILKQKATIKKLKKNISSETIIHLTKLVNNLKTKEEHNETI